MPVRLMCSQQSPLKAVADKGAGFRSLADVWADTTTAHGRLMLTILGGLAKFGVPTRK